MFCNLLTRTFFALCSHRTSCPLFYFLLFPACICWQALGGLFAIVWFLPLCLHCSRGARLRPGLLNFQDFRVWRAPKPRPLQTQIAGKLAPEQIRWKIPLCACNKWVYCLKLKVNTYRQTCRTSRISLVQAQEKDMQSGSGLSGGWWSGGESFHWTSGPRTHLLATVHPAANS